MHRYHGSELTMQAHSQEDDLDLLSTKLRRAQTAYEWACSRGDTERIVQFRIQMDAICAERKRLLIKVGS
jgi:hypothetical protein